MICLSLDMARGEWMRKEYRIKGGGGGGERQKNNEKRRKEEIEKNLYQQEGKKLDNGFIY